MDKKLLGISKSDDKSIASGFDHAVRTGDNTFSIYFIDGSHVDLTIPLPDNGKDGEDGKDGIAVIGLVVDKINKQFKRGLITEEERYNETIKVLAERDHIYMPFVTYCISML